MELTKGQVAKLEAHDYKVSPSGRHLVLFSHDFHKHKAWDEICESLQIPVETKEVVIAYFGVKGEGCDG